MEKYYETDNFLGFFEIVADLQTEDFEAEMNRVYDLFERYKKIYFIKNKIKK